MAWQVHFVNDAIRAAQRGSPLHGLAPIVDPSDEIIEVLLAALRWDMQQRRFGLTAEGLEKLHALSVELLEVLKENMPDRTGGPQGWNFEKAHSILHKVHDILLFGWSENFRHQGPDDLKDDPRLGSASADTQRDRGNGSRLYEVNIWMWRYGRGRPRMVSIAEAERIRSERVSESRIRAAETRKRRSEAAAAGGAAEGGGAGA